MVRITRVPFANTSKQILIFFSFNSNLLDTLKSKETIIALDPCFISKSGKHTPGLGNYWSGCADTVKKGLEISGFAAIDVSRKLCTHLVAHQTLKEKNTSLLDFYGQLVVENAEKLKKVSSYLVADAYFSKKNFIDSCQSVGIHVVSRFRKDVVLRYKYIGAKENKRGRPKTYGDRVDVNNLDMRHFTLFLENEEMRCFQAVVHAKSAKRWVKLVVVHYLEEENEVKNVKIYFCTDTALEGSKVLKYYTLRFQIEFLYRDSKQFTGLEHCQSRDKNSLDFHFNAALTAVSLAKVADYLSENEQAANEKPLGRPFSMASFKVLYFNDLMLNRFLGVFGICPKQAQKYPDYQKLRDFGRLDC